MNSISKNLVDAGPIIEAVIFPSEIICRDYILKGKVIPCYPTFALVDTGSPFSAVSNEVIEYLNLTPNDITETGVTGMFSSTDKIDRKELYHILFGFPDHNTSYPVKAVMFHIPAKIKLPYSAIIGRDMLFHCRIDYVGYENKCSIHLKG